MKKSSFFPLRWLLFAVFVTLTSAEALAVIYYVKPTGDDNDAGTSWATAFQTVQHAINTASSGDQIWVAAGTYKPTTDTDRDISFSMKNGVAIYGGFNGTETMLLQRNWVTNVTILSGDIGTANNNTDNSYHVINNSGLNSTAILNGFTITKGQADGGDERDDGGGMYNHSSSPTVSNCTFSNNFALDDGGGMFNYSSSSPAVSNCIFTGNSTLGNGAGMSNESSSSPTVTQSSFSGNLAQTDGGGMNNQSSSPSVTNCSFSGNSASALGGGMKNFLTSNPSVKNCSFSGNTAAAGGGG